jgi:hypothetical protein
MLILCYLSHFFLFSLFSFLFSLFSFLFSLFSFLFSLFSFLFRKKKFARSTFRPPFHSLSLPLTPSLAQTNTISTYRADVVFKTHPNTKEQEPTRLSHVISDVSGYLLTTSGKFQNILYKYRKNRFRFTKGEILKIAIN